MTAIVIAFAVFAAAAVFAWTTFSERVHEAALLARTPATSGSPAGVDLSGIPEGWTELPAPPDIRSGAAQVWTGSQLLIWGGSPGWCDEQPPERDGMAFDGSSKTWIAIPPAPIPGRCFPADAWTGRELLIWGGWDGSWSEDEPGTLSDGAAYDPATNQWRVLPPSGVTARAPLFVWTGEELIVWGTSLRTRHRPLDGAAYDPVSDSWRLIAEGPIELTDAVGMWTGTEMIVFGAALHGGNFPETPTAIGAAYNPASDTWRQLPESDIDPNANTASWLGDRLIAWDYSEHTTAYSPGSDTWESLRGPPVDACEDVPASVTAEGFVFGQLCGELVVMRPGEDGWHNVTRRDLPFWPASFAPAEDLVFVLGHESFDQGAPTKMFAFRPPASFACGGFPGLHGGELAAAVAARFELLRSYRPEELARPEIADLVTPAGEATKTLIRDALPELADRSAEVQSKLDEFAERYLSEAGAVSPRSLARVLAHEVSPRTAIVEAMTFEMTGGSLQSADQLLSVCASFGIQDRNLTDQVLGIKDAFLARNEIVHEMDMSSGADRWTRRLRSMGPMISMANGVLAVGQEIINRVAEGLRS